MECSEKEVSLLGLMGKTMHLIGKQARMMYAEYDLNKTHSGILFVLYHRKSMSQKELAKEMNVTPPSITSAIKKMEQDGYITRKADEQDQRVMRLELTEKGNSCIDSIKSVAERMDKKVFEGMNAEEKMLFRRLLLQIIENLE